MVVMGFAFNSSAQIIFQDDFETDMGWTLGGEFERGTPQGLGGDHGNADPSAAFGGTNVIGTDLTGLGSYPGDYEPSLTDRADFAISPIIDCSSNATVVLDFQRFLNVESPSYDHAYIDVTTDGSNWTEVWSNTSVVGDADWSMITLDLTTELAGQATAQIRFSNGASDGSWLFSGWNIDNVELREKSTENDILTFSFPADETGAATIDATNHTVDIEVAASTDLTTLVANFSLSTAATAAIGGTAQVSGTTANDFTNPVTYDITAEDGTTVQAWTVTTTLATISSENDITAYSFAEETAAATIDATAHTVDIEVNWLANLTNLTATFSVSAGANATIGGTAQVSGTTANDFTNPVTYDVTAEDGTTIQPWTVTVTQEAAPAGATCGTALPVNLPADFVSDIYQDLSQTTAGLGNWNDTTSLGSYDGGEDIFYEMTVTSTIKVNIELDPKTTTYTGIGIYLSCPGNSNEIAKSTNSSASVHGMNDVLLAPGTYYIMIDTWPSPNNIPDFDLTITNVILNTETDIITYSFSEETGAATIDATNHTVDIEVGMGTDVTALVADFTLSTAATASVGGTAQVSGTTSNDFTSPVTYNVLAEDGSTNQDWIVTVTVATTQSSEKDITAFSFPEETGAATIDATNHTVNIEVNACADLTNLTPSIEVSALASIDPASGVAQDFSSVFTYTVTAEDASTQIWTVTVTKIATPETVCANAAAYTINGADYTNTLCPSTPLYVEVTLDQDYVNVVLTTDGSDFDTKLAYFANCADITDDMTTSPSNPANNLGYDDDGGTSVQSLITETTLSAGTYIACLYGYSTSSGNIQFRVTGTPASEANILTYTIPTQVSSEIFSANDSISVLMPQGTDVTALIADFTLSTNATVTVATVDQVSGTTPNDWTTNPVDYVVLGEDGITTRTWSVWVTTNVGINNVIDSKDVTVYPNPNNGQFNIALNLNVNTVNMEVVNALGQVIAEFNNIDANSTQTINLDQVAEGMYYIRISSDNETIIKKVNVIK